MKNTNVNLYGFASGIAANDPNCGLGPLYLYYHPEILASLPFAMHWEKMLMAVSNTRGKDVLPELTKISAQLAAYTQKAVQAKEAFCVIGGDHSSAIGAWGGVLNALKPNESLGLIWVDAHMDSHTPTTTITDNIHGMPLAHLLGQGFSELGALFSAKKLRPEHVCLIGIRSYEAAEAKFLQNLNVKVIFSDEAHARGIGAVMQEALTHVQTASHIGLTIDLDAFDPSDAPGVGCPEKGGIVAGEFLAAVKSLPQLRNLVGLEITEYNPLRDVDAKTAYLIRDLLQAVF